MPTEGITMTRHDWFAIALVVMLASIGLIDSIERDIIDRKVTELEQQVAVLTQENSNLRYAFENQKNQVTVEVKFDEYPNQKKK